MGVFRKASGEAVQMVGDRVVNRGFHVWRRLEDGTYKCVLCGGVTEFPSNGADCDRYETLTDKERGLCPPRDKGQYKPKR